jgi:hypothetical protein
LNEPHTTHSDPAAAAEDHTPEIETIHTGECPSVSGRSTLTFAIGRHPVDGGLHLRIVSNDGGGMFYEGWASSEAIEVIVKGSTELTSKSFQVLHPGRSVNTAGFVLASLKHLGLIRANEDNSRLHEQVPTVTFEQVVMAAMGQSAPDFSKARKGTKAKKGEA